MATSGRALIGTPVTYSVQLKATRDRVIPPDCGKSVTSSGGDRPSAVTSPRRALTPVPPEETGHRRGGSWRISVTISRGSCNEVPRVFTVSRRPGEGASEAGRRALLSPACWLPRARWPPPVSVAGRRVTAARPPCPPGVLPACGPESTFSLIHEDNSHVGTSVQPTPG